MKNETETLSIAGAVILARVANYLLGDSAPHTPEVNSECEACAILADSLSLLADLRFGKVRS